MPRPDDDEVSQPARRRRPDDDDYDDDRPRKRKTGDATGGVIPYKNGKALAAYYCGVFGLIPCVGAILGPIALILGFLGLSYANKNPETKGKAHAVVGIVLGGLETLGHIAIVALGGISALTK